MRLALARLPLEPAVQLALAATIFVFACGSSGVQEVIDFGRPARWFFLLGLCVLSLLLLAARPPGEIPSLAVYGLGAAFVGLAFSSSVWSVFPTLSLKRATAVTLLLVAAGALGLAAAGREATIRRLLAGLLAGASAVSVAGVVLFVVDRNAAVQGAVPGEPARYRGLGVNPDTVPLLLAVVLPIAVWLLFETRSRRARAGYFLIALLLFATIFASGSRGATAASLAALVFLALVLGPGWRKAPLVALALLVHVVGVSVSDFRPIHAEFRQAVIQPKLPATRPAGIKPPRVRPPAGATGTTGPGGAPVVRLKPKAKRRRPKPAPKPVPKLSAVHDPFDVYEVGRERPYGLYTPTPEGLFGATSGRFQVWVGAFHQAARRPVLGYGFGTEEPIFVDRYYSFQGDRAENSYLGLFLQLGAVGVGLFLAIGLALLATFVRVLRTAPVYRRGPAAVCAACALAGFLLAVVQSYVYSAGNIGTLSFWTAAFLLVATAARTRAAEGAELRAQARIAPREPVEALGR